MSGPKRSQSPPDAPSPAGASTHSQAWERIQTADPIKMRPAAEAPPAFWGQPVVMRGNELIYSRSMSRPGTRPAPPGSENQESGPPPWADEAEAGPPQPGLGEGLRTLQSGNPGMRTGAVILLLVLILAVLNAIYNFKPNRPSGPPPGMGNGAGSSSNAGSGPPPGATPGPSGVSMPSLPPGQCVLVGQITFKDGRRPEFFQQVSNGPKSAKLYQYPGMDITLYVGGQRIVQPAVVDEVGRMGTLFALPPGQEQSTTVEQVVANLAGYKRVVFKNVAIVQGKVALPEIVMVPKT